MARANRSVRLGKSLIGVVLVALVASLSLGPVGCGCSESTPPTSSTTSLALTTTTTLPPSPFSDVSSDHVYYEQIVDLADRGVIGGFTDGRFRPDSRVTRQQFAKMIVIAAGYPVSESDVCPFTDVQKSGSDSFYPDNYVAVCAARGITTGKSSTEFAPEEYLTRAQLITMVARDADLPEPRADYTPPFRDFSVAHYPWARKAHYSGLLDGLEEFEPGQRGAYDFWANATRGEACVLLYNLLHMDTAPATSGGGD